MIMTKDLLDLSADLKCDISITNISDNQQVVALSKKLPNGNYLIDKSIVLRDMQEMEKSGIIESLFYRFSEHEKQYTK